jgi:hypothetical protein
LAGIIRQELPARKKKRSTPDRNAGYRAVLTGSASGFFAIKKNITSMKFFFLLCDYIQ